MYSNSDFKRFFIRYKSEAVMNKESIHSFCLRNKVPYNLLDKWYRDTRHELIPVKAEGYLDSHPQESDPTCNQETVRIMVDIRMSNSVHIQQRNLNHSGLLQLVEMLLERIRLLLNTLVMNHQATTPLGVKQQVLHSFI